MRGALCHGMMMTLTDILSVRGPDILSDELSNLVNLVFGYQGKV